MTTVPSLPQYWEGDRESALQSMRERVMLEAQSHLLTAEPIRETIDTDQVRSIQLQDALNQLRFRVWRKERVKEALRSQWEATRAQQEGMFAITEAKRTVAFAPPTDPMASSQGNFSCSFLWDRKSQLEAQLRSVQLHLHAESVLCEQMSALLHKTKAATMASRQKYDQLRYLQIRLFKRHDEIVTLHARADNEYLHANYSVVKTSLANAEQRDKRQSLLALKKREIESLRSEVNQAGDTIARKAIQEQVTTLQNTERRRRQAAEQVSVLAKTHTEAKSMQALHRDSLDRTHAALSLLQRYQLRRFLSGEPISNQKIDVREIVNSFDRLQFQSASLNKRFAGLAEQENELQLLCADLHAELGALIECQARSAFFPLHRRAVSEVASHSQALDMLAQSDEERVGKKQAIQREAFAATLLLHCQELLLRQLRCLSYISSYSGGHPDQLQEVLGSIRDKESTGVERSPRSPLRKRTLNRKSVHKRTAFLEEADSTCDDDRSMSFPLARLREELTQRLPYRSEVVETVMAYGADILPVRVFSESPHAVDLIFRHEGADASDQKVAISVLAMMVAQGNESIQRKTKDLISAMKQLSTVVVLAYSEVSQKLADTALTPEQSAIFQSEKEKLVATSDDPCLRNLPERLRERLRGAVEGRVKHLAQGRAESVDEGRHTRKGNSDERKAMSVLKSTENTLAAEEERERGEVAMLLRERRIKKSGVVTEKPVRKDTFLPEKISNLSSIRRSADLEKKLLEQVQGIEFKLQRVKSRGTQHTERKLKTSRTHLATVTLPTLAKTAAEFRSATSIRSVKTGVE